MRPCPSDAVLLQLALSPDGSGPSRDSVARHVAECARCREELATLRDTAASLRGSELSGPVASGSCLDDDAIASLAEGRPDTTRSQAELSHLSECGVCRERVVAVSAILRTDEATNLGGRVRAKRLLLLASGLAAAAVLVVAVRGFGGASRGEPRLREAPMTLISAPVPVLPVGPVARLESFAWHRVQRATQYRVTLFSEAGATVWDTGTSDTVALLPSEVHLVSRAVYYWKVEARTDWNRWTTSDLTEFRIGGNP